MVKSICFLLSLDKQIIFLIIKNQNTPMSLSYEKLTNQYEMI